MSRFVKRKIGIAFWASIVIAAAVFVKPLRTAVSDTGEMSLASYFAGPTEKVTFEDASGRLKANDPIFMQREDGSWRQVGYITGADSVSESQQVNLSQEVNLSWYASDFPATECELFQYRSSGSLQEVITTMLPQEKQLRIRQRLAAVMAENGDDLSKSFVPLVQQSLQRSMPVIEEEFKLAVRRHRDDIDSLAQRWNDEIVQERFIPMAKQEIMPIVRRHGQPPAESIGREIWDRASLWRFGWRAVYDKTPLPNRNLVQEEWKRFVQQEAVPVIDRHMEDIVTAVQEIVTDVAANEAIRGEMADVANELATDPETQKLVRTILKETLIDNEKLRKVWSEVWTSDEAKKAIDLAGDRLEPVIRQIGDDLFGNEEQGIDPNFARVLRTQILNKDRRWIIAWHTGAPSSGRIQVSSKQMAYPIVYMAKPDKSINPDVAQKPVKLPVDATQKGSR